MFAAMNNPVSAYQRVGVETGVEAADPHKLILMLFEGARLALAEA
ncbi:MAG: flagellar protein FliS, partial [Betaproteobacteria bacterium]|nr:flagellar protein FliS [Betaproteobacteria bacterium]